MFSVSVLSVERRSGCPGPFFRGPRRDRVLAGEASRERRCSRHARPDSGPVTRRLGLRICGRAVEVACRSLVFLYPGVPVVVADPGLHPLEVALVPTERREVQVVVRVDQMLQASVVSRVRVEYLASFAVENTEAG